MVWITIESTERQLLHIANELDIITPGFSISQLIDACLVFVNFYKMPKVSAQEDVLLTVEGTRENEAPLDFNFRDHCCLSIFLLLLVCIWLELYSQFTITVI